MTIWMALGLGMAFHGALIIWVAGLPRMLRPGETPKADKGTPEAFGLFWIDQYSFIGLALIALGLVLAVPGFLR